jgi:hypothetical protein
MQRDTVRLGSHGYRHQPGLGLLAKTQCSLAILTSPLEHLICIYSMLTSHVRDRSAWDKRRFYNRRFSFWCSSQPFPGRGH